MKKTLLALMLGGAFMASAETASVEFSYLDAVEDYYGSSKKETYDVAVFLPGSVFEGFQLTEIRAQLNNGKGADSFKDFSVWLTKELNIVDKKNSVDLGSYSATIDEDCTVSGQLDEAYTITADGVYVGYSFTVDKLNASSKYPVGIAKCQDPNSFFLHTSRGAASWSNIAVNQGYGCDLTVTLLTDNMPERSVSVSSLDNPIYLQIGEPKSLPVTLVSGGTEDISSVDIEYAINGKDYSAHCDLPSPVAAGLNKRFEVSVEIPAMEETFNAEASFKVAKVNGESNDAADKETVVKVCVLEVLPVHQTLFEEYTGTWCGWCTRGYAALEYIKKNHPDFVVAAFHNGDAMTITNNYPTYVSGFPSAVLNRNTVCDPYYGTEKYDTKLPIVDEILELNSEFTPWIIKVSHNWDSEDLLTAKAEVSNVGGIENANCKLVYLLVADGLSGTSSQWTQSNYYSSYSPSDAVIDELNDFCKGGKYGSGSVQGLIFDDVVISTNGIYGINDSMPANLEPQQVVEHTLTFDLSTVKTGLIADKNKLRVIVALLDENGSVLNCAKNEVNDFSGDAVKVVDSTDAPVEYYNLNGMKVAEPKGGVFIRKQGDKTSKVILK